MNRVGLRTKLVISFLVLSVLPVLLLLFTVFRQYVQDVERTVNQYTSEVVNQVHRGLSTYLNDIDRLLMLRNSYYVSQYAALYDTGQQEESFRFGYRIWEDFNFIKRTRNHIVDLTITLTSGQSVSTLGEFRSRSATPTDYLEDSQDLRRTTRLEPTRWTPYGVYAFSVAQPILSQFGGFIGEMRVWIAVDFFDELLRDVVLGEEGYVALVDEEGRIIYHPSRNRIGTNFFALVPEANTDIFGAEGTSKQSTDELIITSRPYKLTGWHVIGVSRRAELAASLNRFPVLSILLAGGGAVAFTVILSLILSTSLAKPVKHLQEQMRRVSNNDLSVEVDIGGSDEIAELAETFNSMVHRIRGLMDDLVVEQGRIRALEMRAMQEQIKPHFIYNTLDIILSLLEMGEEEKATATVEYLGAFLRTALSQGREMTSLANEIAHTESYLEIQRLRFEGELSFTIENDRTLDSAEVPKLILQPLVENAIVHGFQENARGAKVQVKVEHGENDKLRLAVEDNGRGLATEEMERINRVLSLEEPEEDELYFGLRNTASRVRLTFGEQYTISLSPSQLGGVRAVIELPLEEHERSAGGDQLRLEEVVERGTS